jgi:polygalacturonase
VDCHKASVTHCDINSADDGICLKSGDPKQGGCEDILIEDCAIRSSASAFKFGTSSRGGFRRITARRLRIHDTFRAAIAIESVDGAAIDGVDISDVQATNTGSAIFIRLGHRNKAGEPGSIRNVRISDVTVEIPATPPDANYPHPGPPVRAPHNLFPSSITGLPGHPVGNVSLKNITITFAGGGSRDVAEVPLDRLSSIPEQSERYPEFSMFGELPAWGLYVRHAQDVTLENVVLRATNHDFRSAMVFDDVQKVTLSAVRIEGIGDNPILVTKDVDAIKLLKTEAPAGAKEFIRDLTSKPGSSAGSKPKE